jgi:hypothetical protein
MPTELCAYGFSCAAMMMQPGLTAKRCPNKDTCGTIIELTSEDLIELYQARLENNRRIVERIRMTPGQAAHYLLARRGCPQTPESLGVNETIDQLRDAIAQIETTIAELSVGYIASVGVETHRYSVKRPYNTYEYNKLTAKTAIFPPQVKEELVKVIHLSRDDDPRNIEGRSGIERRNRLLAIMTSVKAATNLLNKAQELASNISIDEVVAEKITSGQL